MSAERPADETARPDLESSAAAPSLERLSVRLQRLEQQLRAFKVLHVGEVNDLAQRIGVIANLHADELQLLLDELTGIAQELATQTAASQAAGGSAGASPTAPGSFADPAAVSPKRAKWLAEEERRARPVRVSRRELLSKRQKSS